MKYKYNIFHDDEGIDADAVQITCADFFALKTASGLIPTQWYLLTDYRTIAPILGSNPLEYHTGDIEQIYVQALDINKVSPKAYSKTYPDEVLTFNGEQYTYLYQMYNSGNSDDGFDTFDVTATLFNQLYLDTDTLEHIDQITDFYAYVEPYAGSESYVELYSVDYGSTWTYNINTKLLTIISAGSSSVIDLTAGFYAEFSYSYPSEYITNGLITARENLKKCIYIQSDYRGRLFRRYKANSTAWAGSGTAGTCYTSGGKLYICLINTSVTPANTSNDWLEIRDDDNFLTTSSIVLKSYYIAADLTTGVDYEMFDNDYFDADTLIINSSIKRYTGSDIDLVFTSNSLITRFKNVNLNVSSGTIFGTIQNSNLTIENSILGSISDSDIKYLISSYLKQISDSDVNEISNSFITNISDCDIFNITTSILKTTSFAYSNVYYLGSCIFYGSFTHNTISYINAVTAYKDFNSNKIQNMYNCNMYEYFIGNLFNYYCYYTNFLGQFLFNKTWASMYGNSDAQRSTYGYTAYNNFFSNCGLNFLDATAQIGSNTFFGSFSNMHSYATPSAANIRISSNTCFGEFSQITGDGLYEIENNLFTLACKSLVFNNGTIYPVYIENGNYIGNLQTITFANTGANQYISNKVRVMSDLFNVKTAKTPSSSSDTGDAGDICWDDTYIYVCVDTDTWHRVEHAEW